MNVNIYICMYACVNIIEDSHAYVNVYIYRYNQWDQGLLNRRFEEKYEYLG